MRDRDSHCLRLMSWPVLLADSPPCGWSTRYPAEQELAGWGTLPRVISAIVLSVKKLGSRRFLQWLARWTTGATQGAGPSQLELTLRLGCTRRDALEPRLVWSEGGAASVMICPHFVVMLLFPCVAASQLRCRGCGVYIWWARLRLYKASTWARCHLHLSRCLERARTLSPDICAVPTHTL
jgi:hypothetical protein